jgi:BlaI family transcriptional regulator, penicillinase repressor
MTTPKQGLSKTEWTLMNIAWAKGKATAREIHDVSLSDKQRDYHTVKTMLERIVVKGYLKREKIGPVYLYMPAVSRPKTLAKEIENFATNVLDNTFAPVLMQLSKKENITSDEIAALKQLIEDKEHELSSDSE